VVFLSTDNTLAFVEKLITAGKGDPSRLHHILMSLRAGKKLFFSDQRYLDSRLAQEIGLVQKPKVNLNLLDRVQNLIDLGAGDSGRLRFIHEMLRKGRHLYKTDIRYLEAKLGEKIDSDDSYHPEVFVASRALHSASIIDKIVVTNTKITKIESQLSSVLNTLSVTNNKISGLETRVSSVIANIATTNENISDVKSQLYHNDQKITSLENQISSINNRFSDFDRTLSGIYSDVTSFEARVLSSISSISSHESQVNTALERLTKFESQLASDDKKLDEPNTDEKKYGKCKNCGKKHYKKLSNYCSTECAVEHLAGQKSKR
jgi:predicted  nucleic acid-binding Zn-ribbon protein